MLFHGPRPLTSTLLALVVASVRTAAAIGAVSLYVLIVGPPAIAVAILFRWPVILYRLGVIAARMGFLLAGVRTVGEGTEHVVPGRAVVYCVNHASNLEPPVIMPFLTPLFPHLIALYKKEMRKIPVLGKVWEVGGFIPIDRSDRAQSDAAIALAVERLRSGYSFLVFPEGTRSRDGSLQPFKKGAFILAIQAQAPVVPVAIIGTGQAMRRGSRLIWPATIRVRFGAPVPTAGLTYDDRDRLTAEVRDRIGTMLQGGEA